MAECGCKHFPMKEDEVRHSVQHCIRDTVISVTVSRTTTSIPLPNKGVSRDHLPPPTTVTTNNF